MVTNLTFFRDTGSPDTDRLVAGIRAWCERALAGAYRLSVRDVAAAPRAAADLPILATPALSLDFPPRVVVGDLSDIPSVMAALGLETVVS